MTRNARQLLAIGLLAGSSASVGCAGRLPLESTGGDPIQLAAPASTQAPQGVATARSKQPFQTQQVVDIATGSLTFIPTRQELVWPKLSISPLGGIGQFYPIAASASFQVPAGEFTGPLQSDPASPGVYFALSDWQNADSFMLIAPPMSPAAPTFTATLGDATASYAQPGLAVGFENLDFPYRIGGPLLFPQGATGSTIALTLPAGTFWFTFAPGVSTTSGDQMGALTSTSSYTAGIASFNPDFKRLAIAFTLQDGDGNLVAGLGQQNLSVTLQDASGSTFTATGSPDILGPGRYGYTVPDLLAPGTFSVDIQVLNGSDSTQSVLSLAPVHR